MKNAHVVTVTFDGRIIERFRNDKLFDKYGNHIPWHEADKMDMESLNNRGIYAVEHKEEAGQQTLDGYSFYLDESGIPQIEIKYRNYNVAELSMDATQFIQSFKDSFIFKLYGKHFHSSVLDYSTRKDLGLECGNKIMDNDFNMHTFCENKYKEYLEAIRESIVEIYKIEQETFMKIQEGKLTNIENTRHDIYNNIVKRVYDKDR